MELEFFGMESKLYLNIYESNYIFIYYIGIFKIYVLGINNFVDIKIF